MLHRTDIIGRLPNLWGGPRKGVSWFVWQLNELWAAWNRGRSGRYGISSCVGFNISVAVNDYVILAKLPHLSESWFTKLEDGASNTYLKDYCEN